MSKDMGTNRYIPTSPDLARFMIFMESTGPGGAEGADMEYVYALAVVVHPWLPAWAEALRAKDKS